ncbi:polysaccharide deacetylase family protein [Acidicapsa dinghuensis]|uniref:Polysaccharide deacetylase family protein n=1 Tax=Acidicapsa dinghuensis TaxID=2218256 RepID=A0ABW1EF42_9BACT|nr:polysaccharide deacetylase family protein [Acidicapsa dinghuensis]
MLGEMIEIGASIAAFAGAAAGGYSYASLAPWSTLFGGALTAPSNPVSGPRQIALTFDDGPNPRMTPQLLDLLEKNKIKATFFLIGSYATQQKELARRIHAAGHAIGDHTWTHPNLSRTGAAKTREELSRTKDAIEQLLGAPVTLFRPPFGARQPATFRIARELGLTPVTWNIIGNDWKAESSEYITARINRQIARNDRQGNATNLVLHDGSHRAQGMDRSFTIEAVRRLIASSTDRHFVTLDAWL